MAEISRPLLYGGLAVLAVAAWIWSSEETVTPKKTKRAPTLKKNVVATEFLPADYDARFEHPKAKVKNLFMPLVLPPQTITVGIEGNEAEKKEDLLRIPGDLADGDGGWTYTGYASVDGVSMAVLENTAKKESGYVKEGQAWKKAKVRRITSESIVLTNEKGVDTVVLRYNPVIEAQRKEKEKGSASANPAAPPPGGVPPFNPVPGMRGPIGRNFPMMPGGAVMVSGG